MRTRNAIERYRRAATAAQREAASGHVWMMSRVGRVNAPHRDLLADQEYVAHLYTKAREAVEDLEFIEWSESAP